MKKIFLFALVAAMMTLRAQEFDPVRKNFGISVGPLGRFDGNGAGLSNVTATVSPATFNANQFSMGSTTNIKSGASVTNLITYPTGGADAIEVRYFGGGGASVVFRADGTNEFYIGAANGVGLGLFNFDSTKTALLTPAGNWELSGGGNFVGSAAGLTDLNGSAVSTGTVPPSQLGSGSSITTKFLRGDSTWQTVSASSEGTFNANQFSMTSSQTNIKSGASVTNIITYASGGADAIEVRYLGGGGASMVFRADGTNEFYLGAANGVGLGLFNFDSTKTALLTPAGNLELSGGGSFVVTDSGVASSMRSNNVYTTNLWADISYTRSNNVSGGVGAGLLNVGGNITITGALHMAGTRVTDDTYSGPAITGINAGATIAQWDVVVMGGAGKWLLADANGDNTYPAVGLAAEAGTDGNPMTVVIGGIIRNDGWNWTDGGTNGIVYLSATAGGLTQTAPSSAGDHIQVIGKVISADSILVTIGDYGIKQ